MEKVRILDDDVVSIYRRGEKKSAKTWLATLFWGDTVRVVGTEDDGSAIVKLPRRVWNDDDKCYDTVEEEGVLSPKVKFRKDALLKVRFVDVAQGDACIVETPQKRFLLIDGGEQQHLHNYLNRAFGHLLGEDRLRCDAVIVSHGDADHYAGLTKLIEAGSPALVVERVFHNGLVKRSGTKESETFGTTVKEGKHTYVTELASDLRNDLPADADASGMAWKAALDKLTGDNKRMVVQRIGYGDDEAFAFLQEENIQVKVLGPILETLEDGTPALRFLHEPGKSSLSASHTINGHSVVLKLAYGNVRFLFGADLNEESEELLLERAAKDSVSLMSEVLKVPHHGSADFSPRLIEAISPVASIISSGDENAGKDYIHPRASLLGALGRYSRGSLDKPLIYVTELVAFFKRLAPEKAGGVPNAYQKTTFGIVHVRTDGERVLVVTHSAANNRKESYAFKVDGRGEIAFEETTVV